MDTMTIGKEQPSFSVSLAEAREVLVSSFSQALTARDAPDIIAFARRNRERPLAFLNSIERVR